MRAMLALFLAVFLAACSQVEMKKDATEYTGQVLVAKYGGDHVRIVDAPCKHVGALLTGWREASMRYKGQDYGACWKSQGAMVFVLDSEGDVSGIPIQAFQAETGA